MRLWMALCVAGALFLSPTLATELGPTDVPGEIDPHSMMTEERDAVFQTGLVAYDAGDFEAAFTAWLPLAQTGNLAAQRNVAHMLRRGLGVEKDLERAAFFYRRAADYGLPGAQANLGLLYLAGDGVPKDEAKAVEWLSQATYSGHTGATFELARLAELGVGMTANQELALKLYARAAAAGHRGAIVYLESLTSQRARPSLPLGE